MTTASAGARKRRARYSDEMRQDILRAARAIIAEEGAGALSIRGIARRIGYSAPALYEYFDGKEAIARALFTDGFGSLAEEMEEMERAHPEPLTRIREMGESYRRFALTHPQEYSIMFSRPIPQFQPSNEELEGIATRAFAPLQRGFMDAIAAGMIAVDADARTLATTAWALMHGLVSLELAGMGGPPPDYDVPPDVIAPADLSTIYADALDILGTGIRHL